MPNPQSANEIDQMARSVMQGLKEGTVKPLTTEVKEKRKRAPRRNYQAEIQRLHDYCECMIAVQNKLLGDEMEKTPEHEDTKKCERLVDSIDAYKDILSRLNGAK